VRLCLKKQQQKLHFKKFKRQADGKETTKKAQKERWEENA
jgi:hypothetical protein